jgi:hypothetical protein
MVAKTSMAFLDAAMDTEDDVLLLFQEFLDALKRVNTI